MKTKIISSIITITMLLLCIAPVSAAYPAHDSNLSKSSSNRVKSAIEYFKGGHILSQSMAANAASISTYTKTTLIETGGKYPVIRVEDTILRKPNTAGITSEDILDSKAMAADRVIVKLKKDAGKDMLNSLLKGFGGTLENKLNSVNNTYIIRFNNYKDSSEIHKVLGLLKRADTVEYAEPDYIAFSLEAPNEPDFAKLWGLNNQGQTGGSLDADIDALEAWDMAKGSKEVTVAVVDTGIDYNHPDLQDNMWRNPGEIPDNGVDDEGNGYIDDVYGWDFWNEDNDPWDDHMHGTHCAGTIGAVGNNGLGVAGVNWNVSLTALKFLSSGGYGSLSDAAEAINYAVKMGIPITSNSWSSSGSSTMLEEAFQNAEAHGVLSIVAAGNYSQDIDTYHAFPAAYTYPGIVSVAASDHSDGMAYFSNYGKVGVDLAAPGVDIYSTIPNNDYTYLSGTSMAAPHVAGAAALIKSLDRSLSGTEIKNILLNSVDPVPAFSGLTASGGRLNIYKALKSLSTPPTPITANLEVKMYNGDTSNMSNSIKPNFMITNKGDTPVELSSISLRYYYTIDGSKPQNFWCDWASIGYANVTGEFIEASPASGADTYLKIGFPSRAGFLNPGESVEIKARFSKADWSNYQQNNDYSFNATGTAYQVWDKVAAYAADTLVWGIEMGGSKPTTTNSTSPSGTPVPTPSGKVTLQMFNSTTQNLTSAVAPNFRLMNSGNSRIRLSDVKIRYYYTVDSDKPQSFWCDWSTTGSESVAGSFVKLPAAADKADYYLELGFSSQAGYLEPGQFTEVRGRFAKADWSGYNQTNDYSYNPSGSNYSDWNSASVYIGEQLAWGIKP